MSSLGVRTSTFLANTKNYGLAYLMCWKITWVDGGRCSCHRSLVHDIHSDVRFANRTLSSSLFWKGFEYQEHTDRNLNASGFCTLLNYCCDWKPFMS